MIIHFIKSFTYNFQATAPGPLANDPRFQLFPPEGDATQEGLMSKGVDMFLRKYTMDGRMSFEEFSLFLKEEEDLPNKGA